MGTVSDQTTDWDDYRTAALERAAQLGNRGPMRFDDNGRLEQDILVESFSYNITSGTRVA